LLRNAQKRDNKKISKKTEGEKKKTGGKKRRILCDEPKWVFLKTFFFFRVFELPLSRNARKIKINKIK
jgi:hypothetical protein